MSEQQTEDRAASATDHELKPLILGTAGHIDHGKTSLIRALTGTNTDRLPEEQKRGITIELGFANLKLPPFDFGIVDVPGHQKFVRTMLSGATGIDVALLVVAADDSINLQTREHFEILKFLDVPCIAIAITKTDRVEPSWVELVEEEIRDLVASSAYENCKIVRTSATSGAGLAELKQALIDAGDVAYDHRKTRDLLPFRMPIDRVFTREGFGTIVTGSVTHGQIRVGQAVQIVPGEGLQFRVRNIQNHDRSLELIGRGQRAALNLVGANLETLEKGHLLVLPGSMPISQCLTVRLTCNLQQTKLKDHQVIRLHVGTSDILGQVRLIDSKQLGEVEKADVLLAQIVLKTPIAVNWRQRIVIRRVSPVETIGVAEVISVRLPKQSRWSSTEVEMLQKLYSDQPCQRVEGAIYFSSSGNLEVENVAAENALTTAEVQACIDKMNLQEIESGNHRWIFHRDRLKNIENLVERRLNRLHDENPKRWLVERDKVAGAFSYLPTPVFQWVLRSMEVQKRLRQNPRGIGLTERGPTLTKNQQKRFEWILDQYNEAGLDPPTIQECAQRADKNKQDVPELIKMAVDSGELVQINSDVILAESAVTAAWRKLELILRQGEGLTVAEIRDVLGISRKMTIPLCEYWDREAWLRRDGDHRFLAKS